MEQLALDDYLDRKRDRRIFMRGRSVLIASEEYGQSFCELRIASVRLSETGYKSDDREHRLKRRALSR
ncbi:MULTISPECIES: hypothetical protein [Xanthomonas]|uniref:Transposase n=1 Tax=Xanthomonas rydalmerensis TaxID=3046274 RepID=A0ABZ0JNA2_9XANT|nr:MULTISPECIES: hypothetical protein [unclassified Xanthomonas]MBB5878579.1 hypothetical protein [Xanthomonas sp. 3498]MBB5943830.1 hypothetical protein [Xanthomonas sp. 3307]WOS41303.1 hypothetical protein QN243_02125 [Xanthomonas sp. DM-2023]WOS45488.1 hypothetical protein QN242_02125 [Xanthomonas sp. DM-2023]WOS49667.1 hypothetical protein QN240_02125 [Xanthomonas sp. DM-2023]